MNKVKKEVYKYWLLGVLIIIFTITIFFMKSLLANFEPKEIAEFDMICINQNVFDNITNMPIVMNISEIKKTEDTVTVIIGAPAFEQIETYFDCKAVNLKLKNSKGSTLDATMGINKIKEGGEKL